MVTVRFAALAALSAVVLTSASATYGYKPVSTAVTEPAPTPAPTPAPKPKCYANGERAVGAPGKPAVPYLKCCQGEPRPKKKDYNYDESKDWGLFCGAAGNFEVTEKSCYDVGEKAIGAPGYPNVDYKPCCNKVSPRVKRTSEQKIASDKWGQFCLGGSAPAAVPEPVVATGKIRCSGAPGYPYVEYVNCGAGRKCAPSPSDGWGSFCIKTGASDCYPAGERNQGAPGYPNVPYLPCCSGATGVSVRGQWGKFCPAEVDYKPKVIVVTAAPTSYIPRAPAPEYKPRSTNAPRTNTPRTNAPRTAAPYEPMPSPDYAAEPAAAPATRGYY